MEVKRKHRRGGLERESRARVLSREQERDETNWRWEGNTEDGGWGGGELHNIREIGKSLWKHHNVYFKMHI